MGLYDRIIHTEEPSIGVHQFMAALGEWERGKMTRAQVITAFNIQAAEEADLDATFALIIPSLDTISLGGHIVLTNVGAAYDTIAQSRGLGFALIQTAGISRLDVRLRVSKVGTGTQSWQLWNDTDSQELGVVDDTGGTGDKQLSTTITPPSPLGPGLKILRFRAKSTVATDDPIYYGASLLIYRVGRMTSQELHEVLLMGEKKIAPYDTSTAVRTRIGL